jgi:hypothetical protein
MANILNFNSNEEIGALLKQAFIRVYPPDGFNPNTYSSKLSNYSKQPYFNWLTLAAAFIGWPSRQTRLQGEQPASRPMTFWGLWLNFLGVNTVKPLSDLGWVWQFLIKPCFFIPLHILKILLSLPINIVALFTEFFPLAVIACCVRGLGVAPGVNLYLDVLKRMVCAFGIGLAYPFLFIARTVTSPWHNIFCAFNEGAAVGGVLGGIILGSLSFITTCVTLFIFWPYVLQAVIPVLLPALVIGKDSLAIWEFATNCVQAAIFIELSLNLLIIAPISKWYFKDKDGGYDTKLRVTVRLSHTNASSASTDRPAPVAGFAAPLSSPISRPMLNAGRPLGEEKSENQNQAGSRPSPGQSLAGLD